MARLRKVLLRSPSPAPVKTRAANAMDAAPRAMRRRRPVPPPPRMDQDTAVRIRREAEASARQAWFAGEPEPANPHPRHTRQSVLWVTTWHLTFESLSDAARARQRARSRHLARA